MTEQLNWTELIPQKGRVTHFSIFTWKIPRTVEPGRLWSIRSQRVRQDWSCLACTLFPKRSEQSPRARFSLLSSFPLNIFLFPLSTQSWPGYDSSSISFKILPNLLSKMLTQMVKNLPAVGDLASIPGVGRSPGEGNGYPLQCSCLENYMDRGAWQATVQGVAKSQAWLSDFLSFQCDIWLSFTFSWYYNL